MDESDFSKEVPRGSILRKIVRVRLQVHGQKQRRLDKHRRYKGYGQGQSQSRKPLLWKMKMTVILIN